MQDVILDVFCFHFRNHFNNLSLILAQQIEEDREEARQIRGFSIFIFNHPFNLFCSVAVSDAQRHRLAVYEADRLVGQLTAQQQANISQEMLEGIVSFLKSKPSNLGVELHVGVDINGGFVFSIRTMIVGHTHRSLDEYFAQLAISM